jgi:hypothetical protein
MKRHLTARDRKKFDEEGYLIVPDALTGKQLRALNEAADTLYQKHGGDPVTGRMEIRNCVAHHPLFLEAAVHPALLSFVVGQMGPDIRIRTSELDVRPPLPRRRPNEKLGQNRRGEPEQWHIDGPSFGFPQLDGLVPIMEVRVGFFLTDLRGPESGNLCLVPGSHKWDYRHLYNDQLELPPEAIVRIQVPPGSAVIFRTGLWHCASSNYSALTRKVLYIAYTYRWIYPSDNLTQNEALLARCTPIQRQLLGGAGRTGEHILGPDPILTPRSPYWFTKPDDLPLLAWQQGREKRRSVSR